MDYRALGRTGLRVSALGFGCGNVGGLVIRGTSAERERAVARAIELGINYFDTAPIYGNGRSEENLGQALRAVGARVHVGTKVRLPARPAGELPGLVVRGLDESLRRLGRERVDLLQLHNPIAGKADGAETASGRTIRLADVRDAVMPAAARLVEQGKVGCFGITALGETPALLDVLDSPAVHTAQVCFNLLNPTAGHPVPAGFPAQDFGGLLARCAERHTGVIVIRVLAAGALSGAETRHPVAVPTVEPIASGPDYATDVRRARLLGALVDEGHADSLVEASLRFALTADAVSTVLLGYSSLEQLEYAAACVAKGPLSPAALTRLPALWGKVG